MRRRSSLCSQTGSRISALTDNGRTGKANDCIVPSNGSHQTKHGHEKTKMVEEMAVEKEAAREYRREVSHTLNNDIAHRAQSEYSYIKSVTKTAMNLHYD